MVFIKLSQVILFPYIIGRFQKKCWVLRIAEEGSKVRTGCVGQDTFSLGVKMTKNTHIYEF